MSMCDCNQGRLPCTCKPIEGAAIVNNIQRFYAGELRANEYVAKAADVDRMICDFYRVTAERDALQERLNAADQGKDDLSFQLSDREASRYDWLQGAQAAEKRVEELQESLVEATVIESALRDQLAERDALLREALKALPYGNAYLGIEQALSASAEPSKESNLSKATAFVERLVYCAGTQQSVATGYLRDILDVLKGNTLPTARVERDERADLENHPRFKGMDFTRAPQHPDYYDSPYANGCWHGWQARAALDKATEGASHE